MRCSGRLRTASRSSRCPPRVSRLRFRFAAASACGDPQRHAVAGSAAAGRVPSTTRSPRACRSWPSTSVPSNAAAPCRRGNPAPACTPRTAPTTPRSAAAAARRPRRRRRSRRPPAERRRRHRRQDQVSARTGFSSPPSPDPRRPRLSLPLGPPARSEQAAGPLFGIVQCRSSGSTSRANCSSCAAARSASSDGTRTRASAPARCQSSMRAAQAAGEPETQSWSM
jgi:hypothetical protein